MKTKLDPPEKRPTPTEPNQKNPYPKLMKQKTQTKHNSNNYKPQAFILSQPNLINLYQKKSDNQSPMLMRILTPTESRNLIKAENKLEVMKIEKA